VSERVLVVPRADVPGGSDFTGVRPAAEGELEALRAIIRRAGRYIARADAEDDPRLKQPIPYVVVRDRQRLYAMRRTRAGGDARLHDRVSVGVGGHLNEVDGTDDPLTAACAREWREELVTDWTPRFRLVGLLNDDSNAVGAVHIGIVFEVEAAGRPVSVRERDKLSGWFATPHELAAMLPEMETWSQLVVAHLLGIRPVALRPA
jgi:predicted NUDIX family phosphoesterase